MHKWLRTSDRGRTGIWANRSDAMCQKDVVSVVAPLVGSSRRGLKPRNARAMEFSCWLPYGTQTEGTQQTLYGQITSCYSRARRSSASLEGSSPSSSSKAAFVIRVHAEPDYTPLVPTKESEAISSMIRDERVLRSSSTPKMRPFVGARYSQHLPA